MINRHYAAMICELIPPAWKPILCQPILQPCWQRLDEFLNQERQSQLIFPPQELLFQALALTAPTAVKVVILGQDPYHNDGQAQGLSFSVPAQEALPPSLRNIYQELESDLGLKRESGDLSDWAQQGVLLLNTVLTVRAHHAGSHQKKGWETITDAIIEQVSEQNSHVVFVLWGKTAQSKQKRIASRHLCLCAPHPSPLSAYRGFFGSRPFSQINSALTQHHQTPIFWGHA